jgi:AraC family transcriptional regulator, alkane utilization regulator
MDKLSALLARYTFNARVFFNGSFCTHNEFRSDGRVGQLHLVVQGPVTFTHGHEAPLRIDEPSMVFYPRGMDHRLEVPDGTVARLLCATIAFDKGNANPLANLLPDCMYIPLAQMISMRHTLEMLFAEASGTAQGREVLLDRLCDLLMIQVIRHEFDNGSHDATVLAGLADPRLGPVLEAMHSSPRNRWQVKSLAELANMSRTGFIAHFKSVVGVPPVEYLKRWRIALACTLLDKGASVKTACAEVGYESAAAFTRAFTEQIGMPPRQWILERRHADEACVRA